MPKPSRRALATLLFALFAPALLDTAAFAAQPAPPSGEYTDSKTLPAGRRGERIRELVDALSSGDPARIRQLAATFTGAFAKIPLEDHLRVLGGLYDRSHGLDLYGVRRYAEGGPPERTVVIVRNRLTGEWMGIQVTFDGTPEERIAGIQIMPARPPRDLPAPAPVTEQQAIAEIGAFVEKLAAAEAFSGTVLVARDHRIVYTAARGVAERNHGVPMRLDAKLNLGSMNKMFTAVTVATLVQEGRLSFDDPVERFLGGKGWTKADLSKVRIAHLLSHTAGFGSYFNDTYRRTARQLLRTIDDYKPLVADETLAFEPGTRWSYSNTGFLLLGAVIEAVTGASYYDAVRQRVYGPAGMKDSDCYDVDLAVPQLATGYSRERTADGVRWRANTFEHVIRGGPAGGGYSTVEDLFRFAEALRAGRLVPAELVNRLWSAKPELHSPDYGFGFGVANDPVKGHIVGHSGGFPGISSVLDIYLDKGWTVAVMSNLDMGAAPVQQKIADVIARIR